MIKKPIISAFIIFFSFLSTKAQYTETINSNRPGTSQGAFSVGTGVLQLETGIAFEKEEHNLLNTEADILALDFSLRYGFWKERFEVSWIGSFQANDITNNRIGGSINVNNFRTNTIGVKYLFYDPHKKWDKEGPNLYSWHANNSFQWKYLIPAVSLYAGANINLKNNIFVPNPDGEISPKIVLSTQNNLGRWVFVTNIVADRIGTDYPSYGFILTLTHAFNSKISAFAETQWFDSDFYADHLFRTGGAFLLNKNFQVDASVLFNAKDTPSRLRAAIGFSYRYDRHKKDEYLEEDVRKTRKKNKKEKRKTKKADKKEKRKSKKREKRNKKGN